MRKLKFLLLCTLTFLYSINAFSQVKIIFDTDIGGDADDLGALVMLHHFIDKGECDLLAVMCWSTEQYAVSAIDAINRYYNHPHIPIGARSGDPYAESWNYTKPIADNFYYELSYASVDDATLLYRKILSKSQDKSITIIVVGPLKNIKNLIESQGDSISDLSGKELIDQKVKEFVIMGGQFPQGANEWNFDGGMPGVTKFVIENISTPITFIGFELGLAIKTGEVFNTIDPKTPLYIGFMHFSKNAPWIKEYYKGKILDSSTYDQAAVLYAVRKGIGVFWDKIENGICLPDDTGGNIWVEGINSNHSYLKLKMDPEDIAKLIESLMLGEF
ncbi:MAG: nucleoside hydrolase [Tenuifilaceae bacterium]|jgi:inosine-uridine nucleoside N-ribohydrolase|nr:nucleoside hydrolase [Tenuifilaceae bacterium]